MSEVTLCYFSSVFYHQHQKPSQLLFMNLQEISFKGFLHYEMITTEDVVFCGQYVVKNII